MVLAEEKISVGKAKTTGIYTREEYDKYISRNNGRRNVISTIKEIKYFEDSEKGNTHTHNTTQHHTTHTNGCGQSQKSAQKRCHLSSPFKGEEIF